MYSVEFPTSETDRELWIADLWERGTEGVVETETPAGCRLRAFFARREDAEALLTAFPEATLETHENRDWVAAARASWEPILAGERFFLVPEWRDDPAPEGRLRIAINPGLACGSGAHEATQLCLEAMERHCRAGRSVLDIGTGSGILSIAAALLGAGRVIACDVDLEAIAIATARFRSAGVDAAVFVGSIDAIRDGSCSLVVSNIGPDAAATMAADALRCLDAGGVAIVSGFEVHDEDRVRAAIERCGGRVSEVAEKGEWRALVYVNARPAAKSATGEDDRDRRSG
ncbi:MAG: 50S ribosomal protein L11 methyltransferase [Bryobacteraceae bacterium]